MRSFDLGVFVVVAAAIFVAGVLGKGRSSPVSRVLLTAGAVACAVHLVIAFRTSFVPVYAGFGALYLLGRSPKVSGLLLRAVGVGGFLAALGGGATAWAFPMFTLPAPTGPHRIGTTSLVLVDSARGEDFTPDSTDRRRLLVRLWYPADSVAGKPAPFLTPLQARAVSGYLSLPSFALSHLANIASHSYPDAPLKAGMPWPTLVFSHGYGAGYESQNTLQMEELASHGYVVVSINHPYESAVADLGTGTPVRFSPPRASNDSVAQARSVELAKSLQTDEDTIRLKETVASVNGLSPEVDTTIVRWTQDTRFVVDRLGWLGGASGRASAVQFDNHLDNVRLGVFGMSLGGATALSFCIEDIRCAAGINLDGITHGAAVDSAVSAPFFFATNGEVRHMHDVFYQRAKGPKWLMTVSHTKHVNFTDLSVISPVLARLGFVGTIPPDRMRAIMNTTVRAFFDEHIKGLPPTSLSDLRGQFPEISLVRERPTGWQPRDMSGVPPVAPGRPR